MSNWMICSRDVAGGLVRDQCDHLARSGGEIHPTAATSKAGRLRLAYALRETTAGRPREPCSLAIVGDHHRGTVGQEPDTDV